ERVVARSAVKNVAAIVAGDFVVAAAAFDFLDADGDVIAFAGRAVVGQIVDADNEVVGARRVIGGVRAVAAPEIIAAGAAIENIVAAEAFECVAAGATDEAVVARGA